MAIIVATIEDGATESDTVACGGGLITGFSADSAFDGAAITLKYNGTNPVKDEEGTVRSIAIDIIVSNCSIVFIITTLLWF